MNLSGLSELHSWVDSRARSHLRRTRNSPLLTTSMGARKLSDIRTEARAFLKRRYPRLSISVVCSLADATVSTVFAEDERSPGAEPKTGVADLIAAVPEASKSLECVRIHNGTLARRLQVVSPESPQEADDSGRVAELGRLIDELPEQALFTLEESFVPAGLRYNPSLREELTFLRPVPRSLLVQAQRLQCELREAKARNVVSSVRQDAGVLSDDYFVLKAVQRIGATHAVAASLDGRPGLRRRYPSLKYPPSDRAPMHELDRMFDSALVLQSTYNYEVFAGARRYVQEAVEWVNKRSWRHIRAQLTFEAADYLTVGWPCEFCASRLRQDPDVGEVLPPYSALCACTSMEWRWADTPAYHLAQLERRTQHRCRLWVVFRSLGPQYKLDLIELLDSIQRLSNVAENVRVDRERRSESAARGEQIKAKNRKLRAELAAVENR